MPRVENLGSNVDHWHRERGDGSSTHDVCLGCHRKLVANPHVYDEVLKPYNTGEPQGEDGWGGDVEHPDYEHEDYSCVVCNKKLKMGDN